MTKTEIKKRIEKLKKLIHHHRYLYHVLDRQDVSESALDSLKKELFDLEQQYPEFVAPDSPTQRIGGKALGKFKKVVHPVLMLSFNDAFSKEDIKEWLKRISRLLSPNELSRIDFYCELKIDGLAMELVYENAILKTGSTRGDGRIGEDVTQNLKTIEAIPLKLRDINKVKRELKKEKLLRIVQFLDKRKNMFPITVIRGEVFIPQKEFRRINKEQEKKGLPKYTNPRNIAAGSIRQLDSKVIASRRLDSFAYDLVADFGQKTHEEKHKILKALGFKTNFHNKYCKNLGEVFKFHKLWQEKREKLSYEIDGIVVQVNDNAIFKKLGIAGKAPRAAIAFKFSLKQAATIVQDIVIQVGRTGALTPVAVLKPVKVGGVTISRATLHNEDEIKKLGIKIGDTVIVGRAGDVIPDVVKVLPELRTGKERLFRMPKKCPSCGVDTKRAEGEAVWRCVNPKCFAKQKKEIYHFTSRKAFNIEGLGPKIVNQLIDAGLIYDPSGIFTLREGDLIPLERFAQKSAENLIKAIQQKKKITLAKFIYALGIRNIGEETAKDLADRFGSLEKIVAARIEDFSHIRDIGPVGAENIYFWFLRKRNVKFLERLKKAGVKIKFPKRKKFLFLKEKTFVLTGSLKTMTRERAKEEISSLGGKISEAVSKNVDYLVVGESPGSKFEKAKHIGIKPIKEKEFLKMIRHSV